jgi:hypothetical protein
MRPRELRLAHDAAYDGLGDSDDDVNVDELADSEL